jgi:geranylgeranyl diphosphate synthase type I
MSSIQLPREIQRPVFSLFTGEMCNVATAQMYDVLWGAEPAMVPPSEITALYRNKTGRYTFSLPLKIGALMAGAEKTECDELEKIGEFMGIVFQIRDDDINLYGSKKESGKPAGSDIKEGKKTLGLSIVYEKADPGEKKRLLSLISSRDISDRDIVEIKTLLTRHEVPSALQSIIEDLNTKAGALINRLHPVNKAALEIFLELTRYNQQRKK